MKQGHDLSRDFASYITTSKYEDMPGPAIEAAKKSVLDTIGVILAGSGAEPALQAVDKFVRSSGGPPEASVLGFGGKAPALMAAFANGAMAHCLDFDDQGADGHHSSSAIVPTVLALAERAGGISGREMITAVALGQDIFLRLRRNLPSRQDWLMSTVLGAFSATASAARVLGLDAEQTANALGIASLNSCGTLELRYGVGSDLGGMYAGFVAKGGVLSALLAQSGMTGTRSVFEGKAGIFNVYFDGQYDRVGMLKDIGRDFLGASLQYKPWPTCGGSHGFIHAMQQAMKDHGLAADDIEQVRVYVGDFHEKLCVPLEARQRPQTPMDARFSIPFILGATMAYGEVGLTQFMGDRLGDPKVLAQAQKVVPVPDSSFDWKTRMPKGRIEVVTRDGSVISRSGDGAPGDEDCPMTWEDLGRKFADCAALAKAGAPSARRIAGVQKMTRGMEELTDGTAIIRELQQ